MVSLADNHYLVSLLVSLADNLYLVSLADNLYLVSLADNLYLVSLRWGPREPPGQWR